MPTKATTKKTTKPVAKKPAAKKPVAKKPVAKKAAAKPAAKPAAKKTTKRATAKPAVKTTTRTATKTATKTAAKPAAKKAASGELSIGDKLDQLHELQSIHTKLDKIQILRGELPMEVSDLEDDIVGMETRIAKIKSDIDVKQEAIGAKKNGIKESETLIARYKSQLDNVKNNREFDALSKEVELQELEIQLHEKKIKESSIGIDQSKELLKETETKLKGYKKNFKEKQVELEKIIQETEKEETSLNKKAVKVEKSIEGRLITAYNRIRSNYKNGLAVVTVERDSCGGCFGTVPPQMQMDIRQRKKILLCEHCGRILVAVSGD